MRWMAVVALVVALGGCTPTQSPEVTLTCRAGKNCEIVWDKAWKWVDDNSDLSVRILDSHRIMTANPPSDEPGLVAYRITKRAVSDDKYEIVFFAWCNLDLFCRDNPEKMANNFVYYMTH